MQKSSRASLPANEKSGLDDRHVIFSPSNTVQKPLKCNTNVKQMLHFVFVFCPPIFAPISALIYLFTGSCVHFYQSPIFAHFVLPPLHVGCDSRRKVMFHLFRCFNPRTHVGCDTPRPAYSPSETVSIHAPM